MNSFKTALQAAGVSAMVFALVACEGNPTTETTVQSPEIKGGTVFSESFADAGMFTIEKNPEGGYNYSVSAQIGSDAEKRMNSSIDVPTLAGVYQQINAGKSETPAIVSEVSDWLESRPSSGLEKAMPTVSPLPLEKAAAQSDFVNGYCRNIYDGSYVWRYTTCDWKPNANYMGTSGVNGDNWANDRVYAWNATPYTATMSLWNSANTAQISTWRPTLQPYWVTWFSWGGTYSNARAAIKLTGTFGGELGLSNHARYAR